MILKVMLHYRPASDSFGHIPATRKTSLMEFEMFNRGLNEVWSSPVWSERCVDRYPCEFNE